MHCGIYFLPSSTLADWWSLSCRILRWTWRCMCFYSKSEYEDKNCIKLEITHLICFSQYHSKLSLLDRILFLFMYVM